MVCQKLVQRQVVEWMLYQLLWTVFWVSGVQGIGMLVGPVVSSTWVVPNVATLLRMALLLRTGWEGGFEYTVVGQWTLNEWAQGL